ncbi:MAG TPA: Arc family DNA-binding protein [Pirellulaceae bacterium]
MTKRDSFLLRLDPKILEALRRWADDELRSVNGQIEFLLRTALKHAGRIAPAGEDQRPPPTSGGGGGT